jgi:hypothetical protein
MFKCKRGLELVANLWETADKKAKQREDLRKKAYEGLTRSIDV